MACELSDIKKLNYEIHRYSSYSPNYLPENIREDCPKNPNSRWSSNTNSPPQYLTLKLFRPGIVKKIKFGKYEKNHVCNLRKFKIFGGIEEDHMLLLFEGGLKNNALSEIFNLRHKTESGEFLPLMYLQIMPLLSWGPSFNFSIWFVELLGQDDPIFVRTTAENSFRNFSALQEIEIVRLCLKHFRLQGYNNAFKALQEETSVQLEHSTIAELHDVLVNRGDFVKSEEFIGKYINEGLMDKYLDQQDYKASWILQDSSYTSDRSEVVIKSAKYQQRPGMRGGHQLVVDGENGLMYLYGGWDGFVDLSDLWLYNIKTKKWSLIHEFSEKEDGPTPRSCHKMVYDPKNSQIFTLGRYLDQSARMRDVIKSDFYLYDTTSKTWLQICDDTSQVGGPQLIFDHQMCLDVDKRTIYVFGGRIVTPRNSDEILSEYQYSGLFSYHIGTNTWTQILVDCGHPTASDPDVESIKSRAAHSMLFHNKHRKLYIFGGQRNKDYTKDFMSFNVDTNEVVVLNTNLNESSETVRVPQPGFTQRATIDCDRDEIYVLSSLSKDKERRDLNVNSLWLYSLKKNEWKIIYKNDHSNECHIKNQNTCSEPCPRYAHQLVYDHFNKVHYLFGGNPGKKSSNTNLRLDDFWILYLEKPSRLLILRQCKYLIRKLEYEEITKANSIEALQYLQTKLYEIIDHDDQAQLKEFHKLASLLFVGDNHQSGSEKQNQINTGKGSLMLIGTPSTSCPEIDTEGSLDSNFSSLMNSIQSQNLIQSKTDEQQFKTKNRRCLLFNKLVEYLPKNLVQPKGNLCDLIIY